MTEAKNITKEELIKNIISELENANSYDYGSDLIFEIGVGDIEPDLRFIETDLLELSKIDKNNQTVKELLKSAQIFNSHMWDVDDKIDTLSGLDEASDHAQDIRENIQDNLAHVAAGVKDAMKLAVSVQKAYAKVNAIEKT